LGVLPWLLRPRIRPDLGVVQGLLRDSEEELRLPELVQDVVGPREPGAAADEFSASLL
jgi:hypothetical protein